MGFTILLLPILLLRRLLRRLLLPILLPFFSPPSVFEHPKRTHGCFLKGFCTSIVDVLVVKRVQLGGFGCGFSSFLGFDCVVWRGGWLRGGCFAYRLALSRFVSVISLASMAALGFFVFVVMYAQQRFGVLCAAPILPFVSMAIRPIDDFMCSLLFTSVMAFSVACCAVCWLCIWSHVCLARTRRMATSPMPVVEHAPAWLSAYVPAPISGESPILPGSFSEYPPVDVAAAVFACLSIATAPTVSVWNRLGLAAMSFFSFGSACIWSFLSFWVSSCQ